MASCREPAPSRLFRAGQRRGERADHRRHEWHRLTDHPVEQLCRQTHVAVDDHEQVPTCHRGAAVDRGTEAAVRLTTDEDHVRSLRKRLGRTVVHYDDFQQVRTHLTQEVRDCLLGERGVPVVCDDRGDGGRIRRPSTHG